MKCPSEIELNDYAEDRLATSRRWEIARHLDDCPGCRTDLEGLDWATAALLGLADADLADEDHPALEDLAALREGKLPASRRAEVLTHLGLCPECASIVGQLPREQRELPLVRHWQPMAAAAGLLLVIGLVFFVARGQFAPGTVALEPAPRHAVEAVAPPPTAAQPRAGAAAKAPAATLPGALVIGTPTQAAAATPAAPHYERGWRAGHKRAGPARVAVTTPLAVRDHERTLPQFKGLVNPGLAAELAPSPGGMRLMTMGPSSRGAHAETPPASALQPTVKMMSPTVGTMDNALPPPVAAVPKFAPGETFRPMSAPTTGAPGAGGMPAGVAAEGGAGPRASVNNILRWDARRLAQIRNDPQAKAQLKAILRMMLRGEKSGERRALIRQALRTIQRA